MANYCATIVRHTIFYTSVLALIIQAVTSRTEKPQRWSRQISNTNFLNDWIPMQPRQSAGRVVNFGPQPQIPYAPIFPNVLSQAAPSEVHQAPPSQPVQLNVLGEPFQQRIIFQQMPQFLNHEQSAPDVNQPSRQLNFPVEMQLNGPQHYIVHNQNVDPNIQQFHPHPPLLSQPQQVDKFPAQNPSFLQNNNHQPQPPHAEHLIDNNHAIHLNNLDKKEKIPSVQHQQQQPPMEEVQLLYVPLGTLYQKQQEKLQNTRYNVLPSPINPSQINDFYATQKEQEREQVDPLSFPATYKYPPSTERATPLTTPVHRFSSNLSNYTFASQRLNPHQPPLAIFMRNSAGITSNQLSVNDVLFTLASSKNIDVLDSANKRSSMVFLGPSGMRTPEAYTKFDLPYLSSIEHNRTERHIYSLPFFVAPLSYRAPRGFTKILLPQPHVGSLIVNSPDNFISTHQTTTNNRIKPSNIQYSPSKNNLGFSFGTELFSSTAKPSIQTEHTPFVSSTPSYYVNDFKQTNSALYNRQPVQKPVVNHNDDSNNNNNLHSIQLTRSQTPASESSRNNSFPFLFGNKNANRPSNDYFSRPQIVSSTTESTLPVKYTFPETFFEDPNPTYTSATLNDSSASITTASPTVPNSTNPPDEYDVYKTKNYFRPQEYTPRIHTSPTPSTAFFETSSYRPIENYVNEKPKQYQGKETYNRNGVSGDVTQSTPITTPRTIITYYTAASIDSNDNQHPTQHQHLVYDKTVKPVTENRLQNEKNIDYYQNNREFEKKEPQNYSPYIKEQYGDLGVTQSYESTRAQYRDHSPRYQTITTDADEYTTVSSQSEYSGVSPNLPGLVNSLLEKERVASSILTTTPPPITTTRRTLTRGRRPQQSNRNSPTVTPTYSSVDTTTRRTRGRRPVNYTNRTTATTSTTVRNPNRVRYNPTAEERTRYRGRQRPTAASNSIKEEQNLDYQRDVLKQNYPAVTPNDTITTFAPLTKLTTSTSERYSEGLFGQDFEKLSSLPLNHQSLDTRNEENSLLQFSNLRDMQIPQQYQGLNKEIDIHDFNYLNSNAKRQKNTVDNRPIYIPSTTHASVQSEDNQYEITEVLRSRKPSIIRRPVPKKTSSVATNAPETADNKATDRYTVRPKARYETTATKSTKINRIRGRRPSASALTTTMEPEINTEIDQSYQPFNKINRDFYKGMSTKKPNKESIRVTVSSIQERKRKPSRFNLDTEETQWSKKAGQNAFHPIYPNNNEETYTLDPMQESDIVTAGSNTDNKESYLFEVTSKPLLGNANKNNETSGNEYLHEKTPSSTTSEATLFDLFDTNDSDKNDNRNHISDNTDPEITTPSIIPTVAENITNHQTNNTNQSNDLKGKRRGVWKRVRVRPVDSFETAESQNIRRYVLNTFTNDNTKNYVDTKFDGKDNYPASAMKYKGNEEDSEAAIVNSETSTNSTDTEITANTELPIQLNSTELEISSTMSTDATETTILPDMTTTIASKLEVDNETVTAVQIDELKNNTVATSTVESPKLEPENRQENIETEEELVDKHPETLESETVKDSEAQGTEETKDFVEDQEPQSSTVIDEVKQKLTELFSFDDDDGADDDVTIDNDNDNDNDNNTDTDDDDDDETDINMNETNPEYIQQDFKRTKQRQPTYTTIERNRLNNINNINNINDNDVLKDSPKVTPSSIKLSPVLKTILHPITEPSSFHKDLMKNVVYATSTSTEISHETEICYRGRCIRTH